MSTTQEPAEGAVQPFQCLVCFKRFTRQENLKRHSIIHRAHTKTFKCDRCSSAFSRKDLLKRHVSKKHREEDEANIDELLLPNVEAGPSSASTSIVTTNGVTTSDLDTILARPQSTSDEWTGSIFDYSTIDNAFMDGGLGSDTSPMSLHTPQVHMDFLSPHDIEIGVRLYFERVSDHFPFLHRATFDVRRASRTLLLGILSVSLQFRENSMESDGLPSRCYQLGSSLLLSETQSQTSTWIIEPEIIQAHILLQVHAILFACGHETRHGLHLLTRTVELARNGGLMEPLPKEADGSKLDALWRQFVREETHKRMAYAVYQLDALWYQTFSRPRLMSHLEIKHSLPCSPERWNAPDASEWAHASLVSPDQGTRYIDAVRSALQPASSAQLLRFGQFGALLVMLFIMSSVREVSGWATMTGKLCTDRFEVMQASLNALGPCVCDGNREPFANSLEATWHMSQIELLLWNAPHTGGLVETTLDAALAAAAIMSASKPVMLALQVAETLDPHLTWFLRYLSGTFDPTSEAPWVTMYAYKAALIAWQLAREGAYDLSHRIGVSDLYGMQEWMRQVFRTRRTWGVGRLIVNSLAELEKMPHHPD